MNGVFCALDGILFYVFFEATLIPMYIIIGVWAAQPACTPRSSSSSTRWLGLLLMLVALVLPVPETAAASILAWQQADRCMKPAQTPLFFLRFLVSFAVKVPMWPVHTWLPDAHVEAPTGGFGGAGGHHA